MTKSSTSRWIGPQSRIEIGQVGFLVQFTHHNQGWERFELLDLPAYTNQSRQPRLYGWCGSYNNLSTQATGMARVERMAKNGRAFVRKLEGDELAAALETLGFPELFDTFVEE